MTLVPTVVATPSRREIRVPRNLPSDCPRVKVSEWLLRFPHREDLPLPSIAIEECRQPEIIPDDPTLGDTPDNPIVIDTDVFITLEEFGPNGRQMVDYTWEQLGEQRQQEYLEWYDTPWNKRGRLFDVPPPNGTLIYT